jgi:hypothetical protein
MVLGTTCKNMGRNDAAGILHQTLEEEKQAMKKLTEIANGNVNQAAAQEAGKEEENENDEEEENVGMKKKFKLLHVYCRRLKHGNK